MKKIKYNDIYKIKIMLSILGISMNMDSND